jgi:hypothetical protein
MAMEANLDLLNTLWTTIENDPTCLQARKLLVEQLTRCGWKDAALDAAKEALKIDPKDQDMLLIVVNNQNNPQIHTQPKALAQRISPKANKKRVSRGNNQSIPAPTSNEERAKLEKELTDALNELPKLAVQLKKDMEILVEYRASQSSLYTINVYPDHADQIELLHNLTLGNTKNLGSQTFPSARAAARVISGASSIDEALEFGILDLEDAYARILSQSQNVNNDDIRDKLAKRCQVITTSLTSRFLGIPKLALMHIEREKLGRNYHNSSSMLGDEISEIPRQEFWVCEGGYAWSMEELSMAISSNGGVMRNPLSREMFSTADIAEIISHPRGAKLQAMAVAQSQMSKGVRPSTITELDKLAQIFLADMSEDQKPSRKALGMLMTR